MSILEKQPQITQNSTCEKSGCCSTTEDGDAVCIVPQSKEPINAESVSCSCASTTSSCGCNSAATLQMDSIEKIPLSPSRSKLSLGDHLAQCNSMWKKIRGGVMFAVACIASPCCTPLIVPLVLSLLAGTPIAVLLGQNLGWVYGGLTLLSGISFVLGWRWMGKKSNRKPVTRISVISSSVSEINS